MRDLTNEIVELIRRTSSDLPKDVEERLRAAVEKEAPGSAARGAFETIMQNIELSRKNSTPICQDTGTPIFYIHYPEGWSTRKLTEQIRNGLAEATKKSYMRPNAVDAIYDKNSGNNLGGDDFPSIHFDEVDADQPLVIELMLKGGGCENVGRQYSLPDNSLGAGATWPGCGKLCSTRSRRRRDRDAHRGFSACPSAATAAHPTSNQRKFCSTRSASAMRTPNWRNSRNVSPTRPTRWVSARWASAARRP